MINMVFPFFAQANGKNPLQRECTTDNVDKVRGNPLPTHHAKVPNYDKHV